MTSTEQAILYNKTGIANVYLLCYPVGNELVVTIHLTIRGKATFKKVLEKLMDANSELMNSIQYIFGGEVT